MYFLPPDQDRHYQLDVKPNDSSGSHALHQTSGTSHGDTTDLPSEDKYFGLGKEGMGEVVNGEGVENGVARGEAGDENVKGEYGKNKDDAWVRELALSIDSRGAGRQEISAECVDRVAAEALWENPWSVATRMLDLVPALLSHILSLVIFAFDGPTFDGKGCHDALHPHPFFGQIV